MKAHALAIAGDDLDLLARAGIRLEVAWPGDGRAHGGVIALAVRGPAPVRRVAIALASAGDGWLHRAWSTDAEPAIADALPESMGGMGRPVDAIDLCWLGQIGAGPEALAGSCLRALRSGLAGLAEPHAERDGERAGWGFDPGGADWLELAKSGADLVGYPEYGWPREPVLTRSGLPMPLAGRGRGGDVTDDGPPVDAATAMALGRAVAAWTAAMAAMASPHGPSPLRPATWTPEAAALLADPGTTGLRRHQAASLYPALAPILVGHHAHGETAALVAAGRPFEAALARALSEWVPAFPESDAPWPMAKVRRLRSMPAGTAGADVATLLKVARDMPVDALPSDGGGWAAMVPAARLALTLHQRYGIPAGSIARQAMALPAGALPTDPDLVDLDDMVQAAADDIATPCLPARYVPRQDLTVRHAAARLLFKGRGLRAIMETSRRWHAGWAGRAGFHGRDDGRVDGGMGAVPPWPALFPDTEAPGGIRLACLVTARDLAAEGGHGPDPDGRQGMGHCVSTYAGRCAASQFHVVSVRAPDEAHGWRRLSTVALMASPRGDRMAVGIVQHRGPRNAEPDPAAVAAVAWLVGRLRALPVPPEVLANLDGADPMAAGGVALARAIPAWTPYLPRVHRCRYPEEARALMARLVAEVVGWP